MSAQASQDSRTAKLLRRFPLVMRRKLLLAWGEILMAALWGMRLLAVGGIPRTAYLALIRKLVRKTELFDAESYLSFNPDVVESGHNPLKHFVVYGDSEGRWPMPLFEPKYYRARVGGCTHCVNSLLHYSLVGRYRGVSPSTWFDLNYYLEQNRDVARSGIDPLKHYLRWGGREGRSPNPQFDGRYYLHTYPEVWESGLNPLLHYIRIGRQEGYVARKLDEAEDSTEAETLTKVQKSSAGDWVRLAGRVLPRDTAAGIDVIVPVYRNRILTWKCLSSVLAAKNTAAYNLIVINDCSPEQKIADDLEEMAARGWITLLTNERNLGFVATANKGMALHPERDIVLLNSDTEVYDGWLDRLCRAAASAEHVASVTPLSNNATICSYPRFLHDNPYPLEIGYPVLDMLAAQANAGIAVEAPTGVGFCLYLNRKALNAVGDFDVAVFGKGYGEENDWCQRAIKRGWRNLIAADTFVRHFGSASFQGQRGLRAANAMKLITKLHPTYETQVRDFIAEDPLRAARQRLDWARLEHQVRKENVLMVCHNRGGGSERHLQEDVAQYQQEGKGIYYLRPVRQKPSHVRVQHPTCRQLLNLTVFKLADTQQLADALLRLRISRIHCHGLVDFKPEAPLNLLQLAQAIKAELYVDIHDYEVICPHINMIDKDGHYCGEPSVIACNNCLHKRGNEYGASDIVKWRKRHHRMLREASRICVPNKDVAERLHRYYSDISIIVEPHEKISIEDIVPQNPPIQFGEKLRIVVIGTIGKMKGFDVVRDCARKAQQQNQPIQFIIMGHTINNRVMTEAGVQITGKYQEQEAQELLQSLDPHIVFLPSIWPETYSYTLSIALRAGLPVFAFDIGAIAERLRTLGLAGHLQPLAMAKRPMQLNQQFIAYRNAHLQDRSKAGVAQESTRA